MRAHRHRDAGPGRPLAARARRRQGIEIVALGRPELDLADPRSIRARVRRAQVADVVVNAAAYTAVDKAEAEEAAGDPDQRRRRRPRRARPRAARRAGHSSLDRLRVRRRARPALPRRRPDRRRSAPMAAPSSPANRRSPTANPAPCDPAHRLGLQPVRREFRQDHAAARRDARRSARRRRSARQRRPARSTSPTRCSQVARAARRAARRRAIRACSI